MARQLLLIGANGALGRQILSAFKAASWSITSVDFTVNPDANYAIQLTQGLSSKQTYSLVDEKVSGLLNGGKVDAIISVAGGWAGIGGSVTVGGNLADENLFDNVDLMVGQSVSSSVVAARLASTHLRSGGLLVLTGSAACLHGTPSMIGYGMAKAAVHHLVRSCAGPGSGMPASSSIVGKLLHWAQGTQPVESGKLYKLVTEKSLTTWTPE
ncbi:hypothetical protein HDV03_003207 [Kappamyces sp. JEL0829]|nr:hypothetical protein HDV03_003207 [Kappamyces sp. JEL0829]